MMAMRIVRTWSGVGQAVWKRALACSPGRVGPGWIPFTDLQLDLTLTEGSGCAHCAAFGPLGKDGEFSGGRRVSAALPHRKVQWTANTKHLPRQRFALMQGVAWRSKKCERGA
jgi:hypothetical protein